MEEDLVARLLAAAGLSALVGNRINWLDRPQADALPSVTLQDISAGRSYTYSGASGTTSPRIQIDSWGASYASAKAVSRAVIAALEPSATVGGTRFSASFLDGGGGASSEDVDGGTKIYRVSQDWIIWNNPI